MLALFLIAGLFYSSPRSAKAEGEGDQQVEEGAQTPPTDPIPPTDDDGDITDETHGGGEVVGLRVQAPDPDINVCRWKNDEKGYEEKGIKTSQLDQTGDHPDIFPIPEGGCPPLETESGGPSTISFCHIPPGNPNNPQAFIDQPTSSWENAHNSGEGDHSLDFVIDSPEDLAACQPANTDDDTDPTGSIEITKYACPEGTTVVRSENGVGGEVPEGCALQSGATFGYVHGDQTDANAPYPELDGPFTPGGATNGSGALIIGNLPADGRYLVVETDDENQQIPAGDILGLYCEGDGDTSGNNDNQELTFVPANGTVHCVAYNKATVSEESACHVDVVSAEGDNGVGNGPAVLAWIHPAWTHVLESVASWIWDSYKVVDPAVTEAKTFTKDFYVDGPVNDATLNLAADNRYWITINGDTVASDTGESNFGTVTGPLDVTSYVDSGWNTITMEVENIGINGETDPERNPAAGIYQLVVNKDEEQKCDQPESQEHTILTVIKNVINLPGNDSPKVPGDFMMHVSWYSGNTNDPSEPYSSFSGSSTGTDFEVNPGTLVAGEDWVPGYSMIGDMNDGPRCAGNATIHQGEHLTCTITNKQLAYGGYDLSCKDITDPEETGWYGEYFNYPKSRDDMYSIYEGDPVPGDDGLFTMKWGQPVNSGDTAYEWYHAGEWGNYFRFARVDSNLEFGDMFWPFYGGLVEEETYGSGRDFDFGVHWSATVDVPVDDADYSFYGKFDDDVFVYVNGVLDTDSSATGVHGPVGVTGTLTLKDGDVIDVYYADRAQGQSTMYMEFLNKDVIFHPHNAACDEQQLSCDPKVNLIKNPGFEAPTVTDNGGTWQLFTNGTPLLEWFAQLIAGGAGPVEIQSGYLGWLGAGGSEQYTELDANASSIVAQDIPTIPGAHYQLSFKYAARPGTTPPEDNAVQVLIDGGLSDSQVMSFVDPGNQPIWYDSATIDFNAADSNTEIGFKDIGPDQGGSSNGLGMFIDDVALYCIPEDEEEPTKETVIVRPSDLNVTGTPTTTDWYFYDDNADAPSTTELPGEYEFVNGPSTPALGVGSVQMSVDVDDGSNDGNNERWNIATNQFAGVDLSDIHAMSFETYQPSTNPGSSDRAIYLNFDVDFDNTVAAPYAGRLVFVPTDNDTVGQDAWESHDAFDAGAAQWRWSRYASNGNKWPDNDPTEVRTWNDIVSSFPNAEMLVGGQLLFRAGEPYAEGFTGAVDDFSIEIDSHTTTYDFEPELRADTASVTICKYEGSTEGDTLAGWDVWLDKVFQPEFAADISAEHDYPGTTSDVEGQGYGCVTLNGVPYGNYSLGENTEPGWEFIESSGSENAGIVTVDEPTESFYIVNDQITGDDDDTTGDDDDTDADSPTLTIVKHTVSEADDTFGFVLSGATSGSTGLTTVEGWATSSPITLNVGSTTVSETLDPDWDLVSVTCDYEGESIGVSVAGGEEINVGEGDDVTCTFTNRLETSGDEEEPGPTPNNGNNTFSSHRHGGGGGGNGEVLGASTSNPFCPFLKEYLNINFKNNPDEVNKAKAFFSAYLGKQLVLNGIFDKDLYDAVVEFQKMFQPDVLAPWAAQYPGVLDDQATGYIYQTTKWKINSIMCPGYEAFPDQLIIAPGTSTHL